MKPITQNMISMIIPMKTKVAFWFLCLLHMSPSATYSPIPHTTVHVTNTKARNQIGLPSVLLSMMLETWERERERWDFSLLLVYERQRCFRKTWLFYTVEYHIYINGAEFGKSHINGKSELVCENRRAIAVLLFGSYQTSRSQVCAEYLWLNS